MNIGKRWVKKVFLHEEELIDNVNCVDINNKDGRYIVALSSYIWVCSLSEGSIITRLKGHKGKVTCLSYTKDCVYFYSGAIDFSIIKWSNLLEIVLKYQFDSPVQMLEINPIYDIVLICGETFYALWKNNKANVKSDNLSKVLSCSWNQQGKLYALGLQSGLIIIIDLKGETRFSFSRTGLIPNEFVHPTTTLCWINDEIIVIGNAGSKLSFYNIHGHQVNKERSLDFVPYFIKTITCQNNTFSSFINYVVIGGSNGQWEVYNNEGIKITNYGKNILANHNENADSKTPQRWPVTCCKPILINDRLIIDQTSSHPMPQLDLEILLGYGDGQLALFRLNFSIVVHSFLNVYALTENSTDVIVSELISGRKARIRCRDVVKGISLYHDTLSILTQSNKIIIYESSKNKALGTKPGKKHKDIVNADQSSSTPQEGILHYKIVNRLTVDDFSLLNKDFDESEMALISTWTSIILGRSRVYLAINYENPNNPSRKMSTLAWQNYCGNIDSSATKKLKLTLATSITSCILAGGPPDNERVLIATSDSKIYACSCNSSESFPFEIMDLSNTQSQGMINRLFINRPFESGIASLDTNGTLCVFKYMPIEADDKLLYQEINVNSFCWCEDVSTMFCYLNSLGNICVYDGTSRVFQVENYKKAIKLIQFSGESIYVIGDEYMDPSEIRIPINDIVNHFISDTKYKDALEYLNRCLYYRSLIKMESAKDMDKELYFALGKAAFLALDFSTARTCFVYAKKYQHLNLLNDLEVNFGQYSDPNEVVKGYLAAFEGDFAGAAQIWKEVGHCKMAADMYCSLGMFEKAKPFLASIERETKPSQNSADNFVSDPSNLDSYVQTAKLMVANGRYEIALDILVQHKLNAELIAMTDQLLNRVILGEVGEPSQQLTKHLVACLEELNKAIPNLNKTVDHLGQPDLEALILLYERIALAKNTSLPSPIYNAVAERLYQYYKCNLGGGDMSEKVLIKLSTLVELHPDSFSAQQLHLNYAFAHMQMGNLGLAVKEYGLAGVEKSVSQILREMIVCDIEEYQYDQAGFHYYQLWSHLNNSKDLTTETQSDENINRNMCLKLAEIYYIYQKIYDYWVHPFTPHTPEEIYHMCRYLEKAINSYQNGLNDSNDINGVSKCLLLTLYAKQALKIGCYSAAKRCVDSFTKGPKMNFNTYVLRVIENRESISLMPLKIRTKKALTHYPNEEDTTNTVHQTINDSSNLGMDVVKSFRQSYFNQTARTILKTKCIQAANISDSEDSHPFCYCCQTHTNFAEINADDTGKLDLFFPNCVVCDQPFICSFLSFDILPLQYVGAEVLNDATEGELFKICVTNTILYFRNVLPDMPLRQCSQCQKIFYAEEWELYLIQHHRCPFCRSLQPDIT